MLTDNSNPMMYSNDPLASTWLDRIRQANKYYEQWERKFDCSKLEDYYTGQQWEATGTDYEPYVVNLVFATIEIKKPTLLFSNPEFQIKPRPRQMSYEMEQATQKSLLRQDLLNTVITDPLLRFPEEAELCILDSFFRFAIMEVGYDSNWIINPNADMPVLRSDNTPMTDWNDNVIKQPKLLPTEERVYVKRIPARNFRVGGIDGSALDRCNWCGYWQYYRTEDILQMPGLMNKDQLHWSGNRSADFMPNDYTNSVGSQEISALTTGDLMKVWTIFDNRAKKRYMFSEQNNVTIHTKKFKRLPLFDLRPHPIGRGFYPYPPVAAWKSSQDEQNESKEQARNHRKRFTRRFIFDETKIVDEEERSKLVNGGDGTYVGAQGDIEKAVIPIPQADLGAESRAAFATSKDDFNIVSGSSDEERQETTGNRTTATQASIINQKAQVRDSALRVKVANWLAAIGKETLLTIEENFTGPMVVRMEVPQGDFGDILQQQTHIWHQITVDDLKVGEHGDGFDFDCGIDIDSLSPIANDDDKQNFIEFLSVLAQFPEVSADPYLIREAAYKCGYRNEKVIQRMQQAAQLMLVQKLNGTMGQPGASGGGLPQGGGVPTQGVPPAAAATVGKMSGQLGAQIQNQLKNHLTNGMLARR